MSVIFTLALAYMSLNLNSKEFGEELTMGGVIV